MYFVGLPSHSDNALCNSAAQLCQCAAFSHACLTYLPHVVVSVYRIYRKSGPHLNIKTVFPDIGIPIIKVIKNHLISILEIPMVVRCIFILRWPLLSQCFWIPCAYTVQCLYNRAIFLTKPVGQRYGVSFYELIDQSHKSHNTLDKNPIMHHFITEMCTHVHISARKWCIVGYE